MSAIVAPADLILNQPNAAADTALVAQIASAVNSYVESQTHRCWGEPKTVTERYDWSKGLWLRHMDVTDVSSIKLGWPGQSQSLVDASGYFFNSFGRVTVFAEGASGTLPQSWQRHDYIEVTYTYGVPDFPDDLKQAAIGIAVGMYNWSKAGGHDVVSTGVGSYRVQYSGSVRGSAMAPSPMNSQTDAYFLTIQGYAMQRV